MAQGKYGTESRPLSSVTTDRVAYEPLTSDPSETYKGSSWFRDDLDSGDKIGTLRFQNDDAGTDIFDIPVFAESESVDGVVKVRAIQTADGEAFIPMVEEGGAFPEWRFQHDGTWYGAHNALDVIPSSVVLQYYGDTYSGGDTTWTDDNGVQNMSLTGGETATTLSDSAEAVGFDGSSDGGGITMPTSLEGASLENSSLEFTVQYSHTDTDCLFGINNDGDQLLLIRPNADEGFNSEAGNMYMRIRDANANDLNFAFDTYTGLNDGNRHDVSIIFNDTTANDVDVIVDGDNKALSFSATGGPNAFTSWDYDMGVARRNSTGSYIQNLACDIGAIRWHNEAITDQTIGDYTGN